MNEEYCVGVQMLLQRMETNPEEFVYGKSIEDWGQDDLSDSRWYYFLPTRTKDEMEGEEYQIGMPEFYLTEAEKKALLNKLSSLYRDKYSGLVMTELMVTTPKKRRK